MAIFKCKMCGGDLEVAEGANITECEYCGTKQTVPTADNEKKVNLFNRANRLRIGGEFDKAAAIYESIVAEFPEEAEAYWGLCLCSYGIEYVDDPATVKKIPTCHRASFESLQKDENFSLALEYADVVAQKVYRDEAREIDRIMSEILAVSKSEKPYDVFICYKETDEKGERTIDSVLAQDIYDALTAKGLKVFFARITLEDKLGKQYEPYIFAALNSAKVMLAIGTKYEYYHAVWVKNEWSRFLKLMAKDKSKTLIPCFKELDAYDMPEEFKMLQAQDMGKVGAIQDLVRGVEKLVGNSQEQTQPAQQATVTQVVGGPNVTVLLKRGRMAIEDGAFEKATGFFDEALNLNPECAEAYLGLAMAEEELITAKELIEEERTDNKNYQRAKQFAGEALLNSLNKLESDYEAYISEQEELMRKEEELKRKQEEEVNRIKAQKQAQSIKAINNAKRFHNIVAAREGHTVGLKSDGTVVAVGKNGEGQCEVSGWTDIVAIAAGYRHTIGLKKDGTVVATKYTGDYYDGQCEVSGWTDIVAISAGDYYTVGLKSDGTVVATKYTGDHYYGQCEFSGWTDIVAVAAGYSHTVGLKKDGTVVAVGDNTFNQRRVYDWTDIVAISAGDDHTVGLKSDGTVVAVGKNYDGQCEVSGWTDIVAVAAGSDHTVGLKSDGTVVAVGSNDDGQCEVSGWTNIVAVAAGKYHSVGLKKDGKVVAVGDNRRGRCEVSGWKLFDNPDNLENERVQRMPIAKQQRIAEQQRIAADRRANGLCQHCGGKFKGLFTKTCTACGKEKDY